LAEGRDGGCTEGEQGGSDDPFWHAAGFRPVERTEQRSRRARCADLAECLCGDYPHPQARIVAQQLFQAPHGIG
jgi:hypothetical protein